MHRESCAVLSQAEKLQGRAYVQHCQRSHLHHETEAEALKLTDKDYTPRLLACLSNKILGCRRLGNVEKL